MAESKRKAIRQAVAALISGVATRIRPTQDSELPARLVYSLAESANRLTIRPARYERVLTVIVEVRVAAAVGGDDEIDDQCQAIEEILFADETFGKLAMRSQLTSTAIGIEEGGQQPQLVAAMNFEVAYSD